MLGKVRLASGIRTHLWPARLAHVPLVREQALPVIGIAPPNAPAEVRPRCDRGTAEICDEMRSGASRAMRPEIVPRLALTRTRAARGRGRTARRFVAPKSPSRSQRMRRRPSRRLRRGRGARAGSRSGSIPATTITGYRRHGQNTQDGAATTTTTRWRRHDHGSAVCGTGWPIGTPGRRPVRARREIGLTTRDRPSARRQAPPAEACGDRVSLGARIRARRPAPPAEACGARRGDHSRHPSSAHPYQHWTARLPRS